MTLSNVIMINDIILKLIKISLKLQQSLKRNILFVKIHVFIVSETGLQIFFYEKLLIKCPWIIKSPLH